MTFVAPAWLLVFAASVLVLLLHARRRRSVAVASIQIWRLIENAGARRPTLRRPPLSVALLLQLLALLLVALALAQPRFGGTPDDHVVFLLDGSGSMRAVDEEPTRFEAALARLKGMVETLGSAGTTRISVILVSDEPTFAVARQVRAAGVVPLIEALSPRGGVADWAAGARLATAVIRDDERLRLVTITDDAVAAGAVAAVLPDVALNVVPFGTAIGNRALTAEVTPIDFAAGVWRMAGAVHFFREDAEPIEVKVSFRLAGDDGYLDFGTITVVPEEGLPTTDEPLPAVVATFDAELRLPGGGSLVLSLQADLAPDDDAAYFAIDPVLRPQVLLLGTAEPDLVRALDAAGVDILQAPALPADRGAGFDLVVVNDVAVDRTPATNVLWLQRGRLATEAAPAPLPDAYFTGWNATHPLSAGVDWADIPAPRAFALPPRPDAEVIVSAGDRAIVDARTTADGRDVRVALGIAASRWEDSASFPLFLANLIDWLALPSGTADACVVGRACTMPAGFTLVGISAPDFDEVAPLRAATFTPDVPGLYRFSGHGRTIEMAVNLDGLTESNLPEPPVDAAWSPPAAHWWRLLLAAAIAVLAAELVVAGRGTERFFRRGALRGGDGAARRRRLQLALRGVALVALVAALLPLPFPERGTTEAIVVVDADGEASLVLPADVGVVIADTAPVLARDAGDDGASRPAGPPLGTNLEGALRLAAAHLPADMAATIVVAGNGITTAGNAGAALPLLQARSITVDALATEAGRPDEVLVTAVEPPRALFAGDRFTLNAFIDSASAGPATITVFRDGEVVSSLTADLVAGSNRIEAAFEAVEAGEHLLEVSVAKAGDPTADNNRAGALVTVRPAPRVMVVAPDADWGEAFASALRVQGFDATVVPPNRTPHRMPLWLEYDLVVLLNVPSIDLLTAQQGLLADFVEIHGRGLLILGGERAFGPGGYYRTDLERISPLSSRVPQDAPGAAIVFVLDRSGSMTAPVDDTNRLTIAKEATIAAVELLHPETQVGVTVFDSEAHRVLPLQRKNEVALQEALAPLQPGGGTELYPGIEDAVQQLIASDAQAKHIVVLTDGLLGPRDFAPIIAEATAGGITISAVAIGSAADFQRASLIARLGGGAFHATQDFRALPSILSQEAMMLSRSPLEVRETPVFWTDRSAPFLAELPDVLPPLDAYVVTSLQPGATLHLAAEDEEGELVPILASWRYGNGMVAAFASHGAGPGSQRWLTMPDYPLLWGQLARALVQPQPATGLSVETVRDGDVVTIAVTALDAAGLPLATETPLLELPDGIVGTAFRTTGPGRYVATFTRPAAGRVDATVHLGEESVVAPTWFGYPAALNFAAARPDDLVRLTAETGGAVVAELPAPPAEGWSFEPQWRPWILIGLVLLLADLWLRYGAFRTFRRTVSRVAEPAREVRPWMGPSAA